MIIGQERGDQEHTLHLQMYLYFQNPRAFSGVKKLLGERYHIEKSNGTPDQNIAYCSKDGDYIEYGEKPQQGKRSDIKDTINRIEGGVRFDEVILSASSYQSAKHIELLMKYQKSPKPVKRTIKWYYGSAGTGKTRSAIEEVGDDYWISGRNLKWWDGYYGQQTIIIDDFRADFCTFHELLRILDRYPYRVETKGSSLWIQERTHTIIITSCYHPRCVYNTREDIQQLLRRIDEIYIFEEIGKKISKRLIYTTPNADSQENISSSIPCETSAENSSENI